MAAELSAMPVVNGYAPHQSYGSVDQQHQQNGNAYSQNGVTSHSVYSQAPPATSSTPAATSSSQTPEVAKDEVGWYFVEQYYTTLSRSPEKLYLFYNKRSQLVSGQETEKMDVCVGQRAINDKIKELDFQDCKVRVTNVDSQASDSNIVIQVIGEISNKSKPHRKFTQTFVLATQTNGYFVLNDIFRYLIDEEDEPEAEAVPEQAEQAEKLQQAPAAESEDQEPAPATEQPEPKTLTSSMDPISIEHDAKGVDQELKDKVLNEPTQTEEESVPAVNGTSEPEQTEEASHVEDAPAASADEPEQPAAAQPEEPSTSEPDLQPEAPKDPAPSPIATPAQQVPSQPAAPPKPALPKTWASLAASAHKVATPVAPQAPSANSQPRQQAAAKPAQQPAAAAASASPSTPSAPSASTAPAAQREKTTTANGQDEWNTVGGSHNRSQSRQAPVQQEQGPQTRGYIKNVDEGIESADLKTHLEQFGELTYFDIARQKNCAFVDFKTPEAYNAAVDANPHILGSDRLYVEERRIRPGSTPYVPRGSFQGRGRGGMQGPPRGGFQGRGSFGNGPRGARGGAPAPRGTRGGAQAV
ncbi:hypothetical protein LTR08_003845 [Meristemomyces frigidus]|nr:hypothetical protein LTR08_003845 [Meristemomyces frigidus]